MYGTPAEGITHAKSNIDAAGNQKGFNSGEIPQFMPFNTLKSPWGKYEKENSEYYGYEFAEEEDYYFSMMVDFDFIMPKDGMVNGQPMVFESDGNKSYNLHIRSFVLFRFDLAGGLLHQQIATSNIGSRQSTLD